MNSIRSHLLIWQIGALLLTGILVSLVTYALAWNAFNRVRNDGLEQIAWSVVRHGTENADGSDADDDKGRFVSQIWGEDGSLSYSSRDDVGPPLQTVGQHEVIWEGQEWHVFTLKDVNLFIQVANTTAARNALFWRFASWFIVPLLLLAGLLGSLIWMAVGRALAPLEEVRREIGSRDVASLHAVDTSGLPDEIAPVVTTLNELLARLDNALNMQRRFVADAAHELRTPLTAVRLHAQLARGLDEPAARQAALDQLLLGADRAARLVEQLLLMARLAPEARLGEAQAVRLDKLAQAAVGEFSAQAEARGIDLGAGDCEPLVIRGYADSVRALLGNLIDNALRYTPAGGQVDVEVREIDGQALISVSDNGPGIPVEERERVFERFHRLAPADVPGSGLGLAIVREAAEQNGGRVVLDEAPGGGLLARVFLPVEGGIRSRG